MTADTVQSLRLQLEEAREIIRQLGENFAIPRGVAYRGVHLSRSELTILEVLLVTEGIAPRPMLRRFVDIALGQFGETGPNTIDCAICRMRRKFEVLAHPVSIVSVYGQGYYLPNEHKQRLHSIRYFLQD